VVGKRQVPAGIPFGSRDELSRDLASNDQDRIVIAIISAALHESDRLYVEGLIVQFQALR
jgi:hypothetical protein